MADDERYYAYGAPKTTTRSTSTAPATSTVNEFGSNELWNAAFPMMMESINRTTAAGLPVGSEDFYMDVAETNKTLTEDQPMSPFEMLMQYFGGRGGGSGVNRANARNAAQILLQLRGKDPYAGLRSALERNAAAARTTGDSAVAALRAALERRTNPYAGIQFNTPMAAANPLAAYMEQTGSSTGQVDALRDLLGSWSANAAAADQEMASRLGTSWQNDQTSRLSDADTTAAAFQQALASNLATQQGALDAQTQQYYADLTRQLADLAMNSGFSLADLGVTL
jgi:hypothetical protein